jgi:hypothetical protein
MVLVAQVAVHLLLIAGLHQRRQLIQAVAVQAVFGKVVQARLVGQAL